MKIDDFMTLVDRYAAYPKWTGKRIKLYSSEEANSGEWFLTLDPNEDYLNPVFDWTCIDISKESMAVVLNAMAELLMTPVDERF
jgi:hypothetical protein